VIFGDDIKIIPILLDGKSDLRFYGYGYRIIIDDWTLVTGVMMMVDA
jgi:hypothetical protein